MLLLSYWKEQYSKSPLLQKAYNNNSNNNNTNDNNKYWKILIWPQIHDGAKRNLEIQSAIPVTLLSLEYCCISDN